MSMMVSPSNAKDIRTGQQPCESSQTLTTNALMGGAKSRGEWMSALHMKHFYTYALSQRA